MLKPTMKSMVRHKKRINAINRVRKRANATEITLTQAGITDNQENLRQFIFEEETRELCFETPRHMELRRRGEDFYFDRIRLLADQSAPEAATQCNCRL